MDWLGYTGDHGSGLNELYEGAVGTTWTLLPRPGRYGYEQMRRYGAAELWTGGPEGTDHIDLSGAACAEVAGEAVAVVEGWSWQRHLEWVGWQGWRVTRLDIAIDLHGGDVSVQQFVDCVQAGRITSRWKPKTMTEMHGIGHGVRPGHTMYLGSPESASRLVVYDKAAERDADESGPPWVRVEWRARHEVAEALAVAVATGGLAAALSHLASYASFHGSDGSVLPAWSRALEAATAAPLKVRKRGGQLDSLEQWIAADVAPSLALLVDLHADQPGWLDALIKRGREKAPAAHKALREQAATARRQKERLTHGDGVS